MAYCKGDGEAGGLLKWLTEQILTPKQCAFNRFPFNWFS